MEPHIDSANIAELNRHFRQFKERVFINLKSDFGKVISQLDITDAAKAELRKKCRAGDWLNIEDKGWVCKTHVFILNIPPYRDHPTFGIYYFPSQLSFLPNEVDVYLNLSKFQFPVEIFRSMVRRLADRFGIVGIPERVQDCILFCSILLKLLDIP